MKPKGINFFEQHVEKVVIGVAGVIVIAIAGKAFFTDPNAVTLGTASHSPSAVDQVLAEKARNLKAKIESPTSLDVPAPDRLTDWLEGQYRQRGDDRAPSIALVAPVAFKLGAEGNSIISTATEMYAEVRAPAPVNLQASSVNYTIDPVEVEAQPDLARRFASSPPFDLNAVHISAEFDGTALRSSLSGFVEGRKPIPAQWVDQDMAILDVVVERQHLLPDGTWSSAEVLSPIPGQVSVRDRLATLAAATRAKDELLAATVTYGASLYQPGFYSLADGTPWSFDLVKRTVPKSPEVLDAERRMRAAWREVERAQDSLNRFLKQKESQPTSRPTDSGGGPGKGGGMEGGGVPSAPEKPDKELRPRETPEETARRRLDERIAKARETYEAAKKSLLDLDPDYTGFPDAVASPTGSTGPSPFGPPPDGKGPLRPDQPPQPSTEHGEWGGWGMEGGGGGKAPPPPSGGKSPGQIAAVKGLFENPAVRVWWHDISAKPGTTYRYRLAVGLYNPFFGRESRLSESQQDLARSAIVTSEWSAWSEPVRVTLPQQFFAVNGIHNEQIDERSASFEVFSFTRGVHRVIAVSCRPGEQIGERRTLPSAEPGGQPLEVDFFTGATLLDVVLVDGGSALNQKVLVVVAMPDGSIEVIDPSDPRREEERQRLRSLATRT